jgi:hypothetical protein
VEVEYDCPYCDKVHTIEIQTINELTYYYCSIEDEHFVPAKVMDENLEKMRKARLDNKS